MGVTFTVLADSEAEAARQLARLCAALALEPLGRPSCRLGGGRWMARAMPKAPAMDRGFDVR